MGTLSTKRRIAKPDDSRLKFFTRELYSKFNSPDDAAANEADEEWELAIANYRRHLRQIKSRLPRGARALASVSLHDAELIGEPRMSASGECLIPVAGGMNIEKSTIHLLRYELADRIRRIHQDGAWPFSKGQVHWLYDELDVSAEHKDCFIHRILFSDGSVVVVPFRDVQVQTWPRELLQDLVLRDHTMGKKIIDKKTSDKRTNEQSGRGRRVVMLD